MVSTLFYLWTKIYDSLSSHSDYTVGWISKKMVFNSWQMHKFYSSPQHPPVQVHIASYPMSTGSTFSGYKLPRERK